MSRKAQLIRGTIDTSAPLSWEELLARVCFLEGLDLNELPLGTEVRDTVIRRIDQLRSDDPLRAAATCFSVSFE